MRPDSFFENGAALAFDAGALERAVGRRARHRRAVGRGARPLRHDVAAQGAAARHRGREPRLHRRPDLRRPDDAGGRLLQRRPVDGGDLPRPRRHAARRRQHAAQPGPGEDLRADRAVRAARLLQRTGRARDGGGRAEAADRRRRQPRLAARPDDRARPGPLRRRLARADARRLQGPRRLGHGPAVERRLDASARRSTSSRASRCRRATARGRCTTSSRRRATRSPTATSTSATPTTSTSRCAACSPTASRPSGAR